MERRKMYKILIQIALLGLLLLSACGAEKEDAAPTVSPEEFEAYIPVISATGEVVPAQWSTLSVAITGIVEEILIKEGEEVEEGQVLLRLQ